MDTSIDTNRSHLYNLLSSIRLREDLRERGPGFRKNLHSQLRRLVSATDVCSGNETINYVQSLTIRQVSCDEICNRLIDVSIRDGYTHAINNLSDFLKPDFQTLQIFRVLSGPLVRQSFALSNDIRCLCGDEASLRSPVFRAMRFSPLFGPLQADCVLVSSVEIEKFPIDLNLNSTREKLEAACGRLDDAVLAFQLVMPISDQPFFHGTSSVGQIVESSKLDFLSDGTGMQLSGGARSFFHGQFLFGDQLHEHISGLFQSIRKYRDNAGYPQLAKAVDMLVRSLGSETTLYEKALFTSIGLEAMLMQGDSGEIKFKIGLRAATVLSQNVEDRVDIHVNIGLTYDSRSSLVHGRPDRSSSAKTQEKIEKHIVATRASSEYLRQLAVLCATELDFSSWSPRTWLLYVMKI